MWTKGTIVTKRTQVNLLASRGLTPPEEGTLRGLTPPARRGSILPADLRLEDVLQPVLDLLVRLLHLLVCQRPVVGLVMLGSGLWGEGFTLAWPGLLVAALVSIPPAPWLVRRIRGR